jgi:hypothetical protein
MSLNQVHIIEKFLSWLKSCPFKCTISSMQGSFIHVKFWLDELEVPKTKDTPVNKDFLKLSDLK